MNWLANSQNHAYGYNAIASSIAPTATPLTKVSQFQGVDLQGDNIFPGVVTKDSYVFFGLDQDHPKTRPPSTTMVTRWARATRPVSSTATRMKCTPAKGARIYQ